MRMKRYTDPTHNLGMRESYAHAHQGFIFEHRAAACRGMRVLSWNVDIVSVYISIAGACEGPCGETTKSKRC